MPPYIYRCIRAVLLLVVWFSYKAECIIVPSGKVGPITPYRSTPRPTPAVGYQAREPAPVMEYSSNNPEPPPLDPSYVPPSYKTLSALSGNSIFYIPLKIKNIHSYSDNSFSNAPPSGSAATLAPPNQPKYVTWKGTHYDGQDEKAVQVRIPIPIQEIDYSFPIKRQQQPMRPIVVPPLRQNGFSKWTSAPASSSQTGVTTANPTISKYTTSENKSPYHNRHYPKKYSGDGSTTKYYYYVKHERR